MLRRSAQKPFVALDLDGSSRGKGRAAGIALVALQLASIIFIAWPSHDGAWSWTGAMLVLAGALLGLWTFWVNRPGNFNIRPEVKPSGKLVLTGPYQTIRHPMYSALLLLMSGITCLDPTWMRWVALATLAAVLYAKTLLEERSLKAKFPEYEAYAKRAGRFIPLLFRSTAGVR